MRRILPVFLSILLIVPIVSMFQPREAHAIVGPALRVVGGTIGEAVVIGMMEKAGAKLVTKTAREKAIDRWQLEAYEKWKADEAAGRNADLWAQVNEIVAGRDPATHQPLEVVPIPEKPGFGKVLVDAALFLTGADIFFEVYKAFQTMSEVEYMSENAQTPYADVYTQVFNFAVRGSSSVNYAGDTLNWKTLYNTVDDTPVYGASEYAPAHPVLNITRATIVGGGLTIEFFVRDRHHPDGVTMTHGPVSYVGDPVSRYMAPPVELPPLEIPEVLQPYYDNPLPETFPQEVPEGMPETIEITVPLPDTAGEVAPETYDMTEPWNEPISEPVPGPGSEPGPEPGSEPSSEPAPVPEGFSNPFGLPIAAGGAILCILESIVMYVLRLFQFIISIPTAPAIPFGNSAFEWFRTARIMGVQIYQVISSLGAVGLSVMVFKIIRRVLP
jgi:hypothetical protein